MRMIQNIHVSPTKKTNTEKLEEYRLSFGTGGLYVSESGSLIEKYSSLKIWDDFIGDAVKKNLLQFNLILTL